MATTAKRLFKAQLGMGIRYGILSFFAVLFIFPVWFMLMSSTKPHLQLMRDTSSYKAFMPGEMYNNDGEFILDDNYEAVFQRVPLARFMLNSLFVTLATVALALVVNSMAAYSFTFLRWPGRDIVLTIIIATFVIPFETIAIPLVLVVNELPWMTREGITMGWLDSYQVLIVPFIADALSIFLFHQFFKSVPRELIEAARIDGANWLQIYYRVIVPISGPVFATATILKFLTIYNQYLWPALSIRTEAYRPVMIGLGYVGARGEVMAYLSVITFPVLIFYLSLQRAFIQSVPASGIQR